MRKSRLVLKIAAFLAALALICFILMITNAFMGNPLSSAFAKKAVEKYVVQNYPTLDLEVDEARYNFKESSYIARAKSRTSVDTHFDVYYRNGRVQRDEYETYVLGKFNTLTRLEDEYSKLVIPILSKIPGLESNRAMVQFEKWEYEKANEKLKLDMKFDKSLLSDMKVTIRADLKDTSLENIAVILENSHRVLRENQCTFTSYDIFSEYEGVLVMISDVAPADIESGNLVKLLQDAQNAEDDSPTGKDKDGKKYEPAKRISVYINKVD